MENIKEEEFLKVLEENKELQKLIHQEIKKNREKDKILFQQNKMASMGEMLNNISHQWRQPLMEISSLFIPIEGKIDLNVDVSKDEIQDAIRRLNDITTYMSNTIEDFRNFFATNKHMSDFKIIDQINTAYKIMGSSFKTNKILLEIVVVKNAKVHGYKNEYTQVLINILNNAKDVLLCRNIKDPKIIITINQIGTEAIVSIEDNAGGIKIEPIDEVFKPFFSLDKQNGTGVGLFMSKLIIENNMHGKLSVQNSQNGALFTIKTSSK